MYKFTLFEEKIVLNTEEIEKRRKVPKNNYILKFTFSRSELRNYDNHYHSSSKFVNIYLVFFKLSVFTVLLLFMLSSMMHECRIGSLNKSIR